MAFRVEITLKAYRDLSGILRWLLAEHAGEQGLNWYAGLNKAIDTLGEIPTRCPRAPENATSRREIRHLLYGNKPHIYRILFTIRDDEVIVLHVRRPKQNPLPMH
jgi:plasmid stabilization system protein ParE